MKTILVAISSLLAITTASVVPIANSASVHVKNSGKDYSYSIHESRGIALQPLAIAAHQPSLIHHQTIHHEIPAAAVPAVPVVKIASSGGIHSAGIHHSSSGQQPQVMDSLQQRFYHGGSSEGHQTVALKAQQAQQAQQQQQVQEVHQTKAASVAAAPAIQGQELAFGLPLGGFPSYGYLPLASPVGLPYTLTYPYRLHYPYNVDF